MEYQSSFPDLKAFAETCVAADRYPDDYHLFDLFECHACGVVAFVLAIEHHSGSKEGDFKGVIFGQCAKCGSRERIFSFTGEHRKHLRTEKPVCECGNESFIVGGCERMEGDAGLLGFFDVGVVVGKCSRCSRNRAFVYTD